MERQDPTVTRISLGQCAVEVECRVPDLDPHLAFLLRDTKGGGGVLQTRFVVDTGDEEDGYVVMRDDSVCYRAGTAGELCTYLVGEIIYHLIENNSRELLIHAACLRRGELGILLPGASGSGKSTISAWLLSRGFQYLTDELVGINTETFEIDAFTRPLNIKHGGMHAIQSTFGSDFGAGETLEGNISHLVPHRLFSPVFEGSTTRVQVVVFPHYSSSADFSLERLSTAKTALLLMQTFVNARNHAEHGFHQMTSFARTVQGFTLEYSGFSQLHALERALDELEKKSA
jgi:hypothetical protein